MSNFEVDLKLLDDIVASIIRYTIAATTFTVTDEIHPKAEYIAGLKDAILSIYYEILTRFPELHILISSVEHERAKDLLKEIRGMMLAVMEIEKILVATRSNL